MSKSPYSGPRRRAGAGPQESVPNPGSALQLMRGMDLARQAQYLAPVQRKGADAPGAGIHAAAQRGVSGSGGPLPYLDTIQAAFGRHDVSGVTAHVGGAATEAARSMGASAYATGDDVAFAGPPDLHTAAHEAAHVVQQRAGVSLYGGVGRDGDGYERQADVVADAVVAGRGAEALLGPVSGRGGAAGVQCKIVQLDTGTPLFRNDGMVIEEDAERGSYELTMTDYGDANGDQMTQALQADLAAWEQKVIATESAAAARREAMDAAEAAFALDDADAEALAAYEAARAEYEQAEAAASRARDVEALRRDQVQRVLSGEVAVDELTREEGDPGLNAYGEPTDALTITGDYDSNSAGGSFEHEQGGQTTRGGGRVNFGDEMGLEGQYGQENGDQSWEASGSARATDDGVVLDGAYSQRDGHDAQSTEIEAVVEADQLAGSMKHERGVDSTDEDGNGVKCLFHVAPSVGAKVEIAPDPSGTQYLLTGELFFGMAVGGDGSFQYTARDGEKNPVGEHSPGAAMTVSASGSLAKTSTFRWTKPLTPDVADVYSRELAGHESGEPLPDLDFLAAWKAAISQALLGNLDGAAMKDPTAASEMAVGEGYETSSQVDWSWCIAASIMGNGGSHGRSGSGTRSLKVGRTAAGVVMTMAFGTEATVSTDGSVTFEGVEITGKATDKNTFGASATFTLDPNAPDFETRFRQLQAMLSQASKVDHLAAASEAHADLRTDWQESKGTESARSLGGGVAGVFELMVTETEFRSDERSADGARMVGGRRTEADASVADTPALHAGRSEQGEAVVDADGLAFAAETQVDSTELAFEAEEWTPAALWKSLTGGGVKGALAERVTRATTELSRIDVSPENMEKFLTERASDLRGWNRVPQTPNNYRAWETLGHRLQNPQAQAPDVERYGHEMAILIDHADALADYMTTEDALYSLELALNHWGEEDLAQNQEFPDSLSSEKVSYLTALTRAEAIRGTFDALCEGDDALRKVNTETRDLILELVRLKRAIEGASDFRDQRAQLEMIAALDEAVGTVRTAKDEVVATLEAGLDPRVETVQGDEEDQHAQRRVGQLEDLLRRYKASEADMFDRMRASLRSYQDEQNGRGLVGQARSAAAIAGAERWSVVDAEYVELVEQWIREVKTLRATYTSAGVDPSRWVVSEDASAPRNLAYEPDADAYEHILRAHSDEEQFWHYKDDSPTVAAIRGY